MTAQSTLNSCSSCEGAFTSSCDEENAGFNAVSTNSSNDGSLFTSFTCGVVRCSRKRTQAMTLYTGASIMRLPTELIILIFQYACDDIEYWFTALTLSLVSREWRSMAHALPELWTHITVDVKYPGRFEMVSWYLHLSSDKPLDVKIDLVGKGDFEDAVDLLVRNATRWRWVDIRCTSLDVPIFKGIKKLEASMLESSRFDVVNCGWDVQRHRDSHAGVYRSESVLTWDHVQRALLDPMFYYGS